MKKWVFLCLILSLTLLLNFQSFAQDEGLIVNEVSTGTGGSNQYVELLLIGCPDERSLAPSTASLADAEPNDVDVGNWIVDDGDVANGHIRFNNIAFWDAVPVGTIIVIYNPQSVNSEITADFNATGDQTLVLPINATDPSNSSVFLFQQTTDAAYPGTTYNNPDASSWTARMNIDVNDAIQTRDPNETPTPYNTVFHGIRWGSSTLAGTVDETGGLALDAAGEVIFFNTGTLAADQDYTSNTRFDRSTTLNPDNSDNETPGEQNNIGNGVYITRLRTFSNAGSDKIVCGNIIPSDGVNALSASSTNSNWTGTYWQFTSPNNGSWSEVSGAAGITILDPTLTTTGINVASSSTPVTYTFQWTQPGSCADGDQVNVTFLGNVSPSITPPGFEVCPVDPTTPNIWEVDLNYTIVDLSAFPAVSVTNEWTVDSGPGAATFAPTATPTSSGTTKITITTAGTYTFKMTSKVIQSDGTPVCDGEGTVTVVFKDFNDVDAGPDQELCFLDTQTATLAGSAISGTSMWSVISATDGGSTGDITFADNTNPTTTITAANPGRYTLRWAVDIGDAGGCEISDTVEVLFSPEIQNLTTNRPEPICVLTTNLEGGSTPFLEVGQWSLVSTPLGSGVTSDDIIFSADTSYQTSVTVPVSGEYQFAWTTGIGACAKTSSPVTVEFPEPLPALQATVDTVTIFFGQGLEIGARTLDVRYLNPNRFIPTDTIPDVSYLWTPSTNLSDPTIANPVVNPEETTQYTVTITSNVGICDTMIVTTVFVVLEIPVPNVFTPNSDNVNDAWEIPLLEAFPDAVVTVYNRWGNLIYEGTGYSTPWDGNNRSGDLVIDGTYFYTIKLNPNQTVRVSINGDGEIIQEGVQTQVSGYVEIIR